VRARDSLHSSSVASVMWPTVATRRTVGRGWPGRWGCDQPKKSRLFHLIEQILGHCRLAVILRPQSAISRHQHRHLASKESDSLAFRLCPVRKEECQKTIVIRNRPSGKEHTSFGRARDAPKVVQTTIGGLHLPRTPVASAYEMMNPWMMKKKSLQVGPTRISPHC
jgi:hypothetical protein